MSTRTPSYAWPWSSASTPKRSTTKSWLFPPQTREVPFDEKWSYVAKKEKNGAPEEPSDRQQGDNGDHGAFDPEHRLVVGVVPGKRTEDEVHQLVQDFQQRTGGRIMNLMTSDEYPVYKTRL